MWTQGIHYQRITERSILYNLPLIVDWVANRDTPDKHQNAIDAYLKSLPSAITTGKRGKAA